MPSIRTQVRSTLLHLLSRVFLCCLKAWHVICFYRGIDACQEFLDILHSILSYRRTIAKYLLVFLSRDKCNDKPIQSLKWMPPPRSLLSRQTKIACREEFSGHPVVHEVIVDPIPVNYPIVPLWQRHRKVLKTKIDRVPSLGYEGFFKIFHLSFRSRFRTNLHGRSRKKKPRQTPQAVCFLQAQCAPERTLCLLWYRITIQ